MGFLDRFRSQPKWKHADATTRLTGVEELSLQQQDVLGALARQDADARVRRAAVRKVYDPAVLKDVITRDEDAGVREEAGAVLLDLAIGAFEDSTESESLKALDHLDDAKDLAAVAKHARAEAVSLAALSRLTDVKAIASVARRADHASTRLEALARVGDAEELFAIALRSDHRDVALAAVERVSTVEHLRTLATKAAQKPVARRARGLLRGVEEAAAAARAAEEPAAPAQPVTDWDAERDKVLRSLDEAAAGRDARSLEAGIARAEARWAQIERDALASADPERTARFAAACDLVRGAMARMSDEEAQRAARAAEASRQQEARTAECARLETLAAAIAQAGEGGTSDVGVSPGQVPAEIEQARQRWAALDTPLVGADERDGLERRFERACAACERESERARALAGRRARLAELAAEAETFAAQAAAATGGDTDRAAWTALKREWADLGGSATAGSAVAARFEQAQASVNRVDADAREREQQRQREALQRLQQTAERLEAVSKSESLTLKDGERALRDVRAALDGLASLGKKERGELSERLRDIQAALFPRVQELRETDEWARWANVGIQEDLCRKAEALAQVEDAAEAARLLRDLQAQWKQASAVPRDRARDLWERFKKAGDAVHARAEVHFAQEATERAANLAAKEELCQQTEALADSSDWIRTAEAIKQLQVRWKAIGPVPRGHEKAVWERFRAACDRFFTRRREDLVRRKDEWAGNLARKEALIAQAEALADTTADWDRAIAEIKRLQAEWKTVGAVRKNRSEDVWLRFRGACDRFFERYQQRDHLQVAANVTAREAICQELEALLPPAAGAPAPEGALEPSAAEPAAPPAPPDDLAARVASLRARWQHAPTLMPREVLAGLTSRFDDALARAVGVYPDAFRGSDLDPAAAARQAEDLCARIESLAPGAPEPEASSSPTAILAARLREALAANTIGGVTVADAEARGKTALAAVKEAQAAWARLAPLPRDAAADLRARFDRACRRVVESAGRTR